MNMTRHRDIDFRKNPYTTAFAIYFSTNWNNLDYSQDSSSKNFNRDYAEIYHLNHMFKTGFATPSLVNTSTNPVNKEKSYAKIVHDLFKKNKSKIKVSSYLEIIAGSQLENSNLLDRENYDQTFNQFIFMFPDLDKTDFEEFISKPYENILIKSDSLNAYYPKVAGGFEKKIKINDSKNLQALSLKMGKFPLLHYLIDEYKLTLI